MINRNYIPLSGYHCGNPGTVANADVDSTNYDVDSVLSYTVSYTLRSRGR